MIFTWSIFDGKSIEYSYNKALNKIIPLFISGTKLWTVVHMVYHMFIPFKY